jgi:hypothetical protein
MAHVSLLGRRARRNGAGRLVGGIGGLAAGAGLAYFLDAARERGARAAAGEPAGGGGPARARRLPIAFLTVRAVLGIGLLRTVLAAAAWSILTHRLGGSRRAKPYGGARARKTAGAADGAPPRPERRPGQEDRGTGLAPEPIVAPSELLASPVAPGERPVADEWPRNRDRTPDLTERIRPEDDDLA